jgi:hypothetical protein
MHRPLAIVVLCLVALVIAAPPANAIDKCKAKVDKRTGVISVDALGVGGPLLWGATQGNETNPFFNEGTCNGGASWKRCQLGDPNTLAAKTPPPACTLYLDDGVAPCSVWIGGCTPGPREVGVDLVQVEADIASLVDKTQCITADATNTYVTACNLHVRSGSGATDGAVNGVGNLIVGYDENLANTKTGSHNLVVGRWHSYTSYAGFVAGENNTVSGTSSTVSGGRSSAATGPMSAVHGGYLSLASGAFATISGGVSGTASGQFSVVSGGAANVASGSAATVGGGDQRTASGTNDWRAGALFEDF